MATKAYEQFIKGENREFENELQVYFSDGSAITVDTAIFELADREKTKVLTNGSATITQVSSAEVRINYTLDTSSLDPDTYNGEFIFTVNGKQYKDQNTVKITEAIA